MKYWMLENKTLMKVRFIQVQVSNGFMWFSYKVTRILQ
jgi:hypothetical protein